MHLNAFLGNFLCYIFLPIYDVLAATIFGQGHDVAVGPMFAGYGTCVFAMTVTC